MSQVCQVTGRRPMYGQNVSHANNKTKRRFNVNLQCKRFYLESEKRFVSLRVSARGIRTIDKLGVEAVLTNLGLYKNDVAVSKECAKN
jgi:large subunit ribosomal protein L28